VSRNPVRPSQEYKSGVVITTTILLSYFTFSPFSSCRQGLIHTSHNLVNTNNLSFNLGNKKKNQVVSGRECIAGLLIILLSRLPRDS
jgi:hypothetical protein